MSYILRNDRAERHPAQGRSTLILPEHSEYSLDGEIADRVSIQAARVLGPHDAVIINRTSLPVRGFTVDFTPLGAVELLGIPQGELVNRMRTGGRALFPVLGAGPGGRGNPDVGIKQLRLMSVFYKPGFCSIAIVTP